MAHSLAVNTWKTYKTAVDSLLKFRKLYGLLDSWPVPLDELINFVAYLSYSGFSPSTVSTYISGISHEHKKRGLVDKTSNFLIVKILEGLRRKRTKSRDLRSPVTLHILRKIVQALKNVCSSNYEACLFSSAFTLAFFALLRIGEISADSTSNTGSHVIQYEDVCFSTSNEIYLKITSSKADQRGNGITLIISEQKGSYSDLCPVKLLKQFLLKRNPIKNSPLFVHFDGTNLTRYQFNSVLMKTLKFCNITEHVRSHSFRIGGASELARRGVPDNEIKLWGRWNSNAYSSYIRLDF